ncbi:CARDB domain-containing protein [Natrialbaceae archaeon GCM10025810]|uniref:DUF7282 domain-containing protein n=1 Tax=Halovalidus salilacus TaxID=3075124 RepID=UPI00360DF792
MEFRTIKRVGAIVIALGIVLAAGLVVGQAPSIFGVDDEPTASITFEDQRGNGSSVTVEDVRLSEGGFVVVQDGSGETVAVSEYLEPGEHDTVTIEADESEGELLGRLTATAHRDTTDDEEYAYNETDGEEDRPYLEDGYPVSDTATVTAEDSASSEEFDDSFVVESMDAPSSATTNETINVTAEIRNPNEYRDQQPVEFRLDGRVLEEQVLDLDPEESQEVTFEADTSGTEPGNRTLGVYTDGDGELAEIDLEFHTDPDVTVTDANASTAQVDAAIPEEGFVAVEDNDTVVGTSEELEPGEHENVTVEFDEDVDEDAELTASLYAGDPDELEDGDAEPIEDDEGEPISTTFSPADFESEDGEENGDGDDGNGDDGTDDDDGNGDDGDGNGDDGTGDDGDE